MQMEIKGTWEPRWKETQRVEGEENEVGRVWKPQKQNGGRGVGGVDMAGNGGLEGS